MMEALLLSSAIFLVRVVFNLYIYVLLARFLLQLVGASYYNPISQFVIKLTNPLVKPLQKLIPKFHSIDFAILVLLILLETIKIILLSLMNQFWEPIYFSPLLALIVLAKKLITFYMFALVLRALLSWIVPSTRMELYEPLYLLTEPLLKPVRRLVPQIAGFDISPVIVIIILSLLSMLLTFPLLILGRTLYYTI